MSKRPSNTNKSKSGDSQPTPPYQNIDASFFESFVSGALRPFLPLYDSDDELRKLNTVIIEGTLNDEQMKQWCTGNILPKEILEKLNVSDGDNFTLCVGEEKNTLHATFSKPEDFLEPLIDLDIPNPPDFKAEAFLNFIENEFEFMKRRAQKVLDSSSSAEHLALYANKNIQFLKEIAPRANAVDKQLDKGNNSFLNDANLYILYVLKEFLIRAIIFYQELFHPFLKQTKEDYNDLKCILYGSVHPKILIQQLHKKFNFLEYKNIHDICNYINAGILQIELFLSGKVKDIKQFNLSGAFSKLHIEIRKPENFTSKNITLLNKYWDVLETIRYNVDQGEFSENVNTEDSFFSQIESEVTNIQDTIVSFLDVRNLIPDEIEKHSVIDIMLNKKDESNVQNTVNKTPSNITADFHPSLIAFLKTADIAHKYKSDYSCYGFYIDLKYSFNALEADILNLYTTIPQSDKTYFIDAYIKKIKLVSDNYMAGEVDSAINYLKENKCSIVDIFEKQLSAFPMHIQPTSFPGYFMRSYVELRERGIHWKDLDMHQEFIFLISDHYIDKVSNFFKNLLSPVSNNISQVAALPAIKQDKIIPIAFTYKKYSSNVPALTDMLASLKKNKFISKDTDIKEFRKIFDNKKPNHTIQWIGNISELRYFVRLLNSVLKLITDLKKDIWKVTGALFIDENNNPFDWKKIRGQKKPAKAKADLLENAVEHLK